MKKRKLRMTLAANISLGTFLGILLSASIIGVFSFYLHRQDTIESSADYALAAAQAVATSVDPVQYQEIISTGEKNQHWYEVKKFADQMAVRTGVMFLYVLDSEYGETVTYFVEGTEPGLDSAIDLGEQESVGYYPDEMFAALSNGMPATTDIYDSEGYGMMVSAFVPILGENNIPVGVACVDIGVDDVLLASHAFGIRTAIMVVVLSLLFSLLSMWYYGRCLKPLKNLSQASDKIARGDLNVGLSICSNDEIGDLTASFQKMVESTQTQVSALETLAAGDLTVHIAPRSDQDVMSLAMTKMISHLSNMLTEINESTSHVSTGAQQLANAAQFLSQGATEQTAAVEDLEYAITQVADKAGSNATKAGDAVSLAVSIKDSVQKGSDQMDRMVEAVKEISEASSSINKVIKVIDDIAFQTNILALNAAVEAARAGQHGKGFAVVADEVRNLAAKSAEAAKETGVLLTDSINKAEIGTRIANETSASFVEIISQLDQNTNIVEGIAKISEEQGAAIDRIKGTISQVTQVVQRNSATAEESAAASEEMNAQSVMLKKSVSQFKLENMR